MPQLQSKMDNVVIELVYKIMVDILSFDIESFDIFDEPPCGRENPIFPSLSTNQKWKVVQWACERTPYSIAELILLFKNAIKPRFFRNELKLRTPSLTKRYHFCGPGTNIKKRTDANKIPYLFSQPINRIDTVCLQHDIAYGIGDRRLADKEMLQRLKSMKRGLTSEEKHGRFVCRLLIGIKYALRL